MKRSRWEGSEEALAAEALACGAWTGRARELLYENTQIGQSTAPPPAPTAQELALLISRPDVPAEQLLRSSRDVFHHSRSVRDVEEMRKSLQSKPLSGNAHFVWPANALARLEGSRRVGCFVTQSSFLIGRGSKCDLDLSSEWPSLVVSRKAALLSLRSDGQLWVCCKGAPIFVDGAMLNKGCSAALRPIALLQIGPCTIVVQSNTGLLQTLMQ